MQVVCKRCSHTWDYKGNAKRISCSHCKTSITLEPPPPPPPQSEPEPQSQPEEQQQQQQAKRKHEEAFLPLPLAQQLSKFLLSRLIGIAVGNGEKSVSFRINDQGELYPRDL